MTMSWVAEAKATITANAPIAVSPPLGPTAAIPTRPAATTICDNSIQPRRRPMAPSSGTSTRSTTGAQNGFST